MTNHTCPTCGRDDFGREVDMKAHHTLAHGESLINRDNPQTCPMCGDVFESEAGMKAHHALIHAESIAESRSLAQSTRQTVLARDDRRCQRCDIEVAAGDEDVAEFQLHHLIPFAAGGPNHPENLVTLCDDCHTQAHELMKTLVENHPELLKELRTIVCDPG